MESKRTQSAQATAFAIATRIPSAATIIEKTLIKPPRTEGERDTITPIIPKKIATNARMNPPTALTKKLAMAAPRAMIDGMLKCGFAAAVSIRENSAGVLENE